MFSAPPRPRERRSGRRAARNPEDRDLTASTLFAHPLRPPGRLAKRGMMKAMIRLHQIVRIWPIGHGYLMADEERVTTMQLTEEQARSKWCPMVRSENGGRSDSTSQNRCIASNCMAWREYRISYSHGNSPIEKHGYCGLAGQPSALT